MNLELINCKYISKYIRFVFLNNAPFYFDVLLQATASVSQDGGRTTASVISFQRTQSRGLTQTITAWSRTATCWVSRMFKKGWDSRDFSPTGGIFSYCSSLFSFPVVGENSNRHRDLLDGPEWWNSRGCVGVEWWESFHRILVVSYTNF